MPVKSYPFIDIAVHENVRDHFARGDAAILFAPDLSEILWSNGEGASLFGLDSIYDFLDGGPDVANVAFRQMQGAARQLREVGETRRFLMRVASGFRSIPVNASMTLIDIRAGEKAILFAAPRAGRTTSAAEAAARMISGFDDPDTHMAVLDGAGQVLACSPQFAALGMTERTLLSLVEAVGRDSDWLLKRPVPTGKGTLPAAIGKLSSDPALHLLFAVETILGHMDATAEFEAPVAVTEAAMAVELPHEPAHEPEMVEEVEGATGTGTGDGDDAPQEASQQNDEAIEVVEALDEPAADMTAESDSPDASVDMGERSDLFEEHEDAASAADATQSFPASADETDSAPDKTPDEADTATPEDDLPLSKEAAVEPETDEPADDSEDQPSADAVLPPDVSDDTPGEAMLQDGRAPGFVFDPAMRAIRFVWKIGADGRFSEISREFALAVGPRAADVIGQSFADLAGRFALDPDRAIVDLLNRRDTWSGKTVLWPVEGEALSVPVDLAALPTYSRDREFDGFRGFGIVRVSDMVADPAARGLVLTGAEPLSDIEDEPGQSEPDVFVAEVEVRETLEDDGDFFAAAEPDDVLPGSPADDLAEDGLPRDPFMGERPALKLVETPSRRMSDNIVPLEDARPANIETLTRSEQAAFREIARQLTTTFGKRTEPPVPIDAGGASATDDAVIASDVEAPGISAETITAEPGSDVDHAEALVEGDAPAAEDMDPVQVTADDRDTPAEDTTAEASNVDAEELAAEQGATESDAPASVEAHVPFDNDKESTQEETPDAVEASTADVASGDESTVSATTGTDDALLSPAMVDRLPVAMLIHSGDELYHANAEFLTLTGYQTLQDLRVEGGIDALFVGDDEGILDVPPGAMMMIRNDGRLLLVTARLQSIRFEDKGAALMMSIAVVQTPALPRLVVSKADDVVSLPAPMTAEVESSADGSLAESLTHAEAQVQTLRIETEELRSILETATDGVVVIGADGEIRSLNGSANALFNYNDVDVIGKPFATLFAHESQRAVMDYLSGLSGHGVASVLNDGREVIGREASGGFIPLFMTMGRLSSSNGYCAVIRDITQWKRTEEELRSAKRAAETANAHKTDFLARVSHEIRTPLNAIIGFSDMMASEHFGAIGNARYVEYASDIGRSGRHVLDIVNDLLDISKIEAGEMELEFSSVELNEAVSEAVSLVQPQANAQRVIIRTSLSTSVPSVVADNRSIKQIALNILANAIRFTPSGGQIVVSTAYEANGSVMLRIRDTGIGMTRTELEQAMKPFRQVTTGVRKRGEGTGLGLPLTKAMAEANRALFAINSAPNEGTLVEITFPSQRVLAN